MSANPTDRREIRLEARAALSAYLVLSGIWFVLAISYVGIGLKDPASGCLTVSFLLFSVGLAWVFWLRGFRLRLTSEQLEYRDGLYRTSVIPLKDVTEAKHTWVDFPNLPRKLKVPRLVIKLGPHSKHVIVNSKPFRLQDIQGVLHALQEKANHK